MILYRAVSNAEKQDYDVDETFRTGNNTLEAKQFFKSKDAVTDFVESAVMQNYQPPYIYLLTINVDAQMFDSVVHDDMMLDGFEAISIDEDHLPNFNNCINFVETEAL